MNPYELDRLVLEFIKGNSDAFDTIYYETQKSVYLSIRLIISNKDVIEDLMQDTYMKALDNLESYKIGTNFNAWISKIARNTAINYYNKNKRVDVLDSSDNVFQIEDSSPKLKYYLDFLEGQEKDVVIYHIILNMGFKEIANIINVPQSTAFYIYKSAIKKIRSNI